MTSELTADDTPQGAAYERVLEFWFGTLGEDGTAGAAYAKRWWRKDAAFDQQLRELFVADHRAIGANEREDWLETPRGRLAYVVVLDQFSRNMFRDTPEAFASDPRCCQVVEEGLSAGDDQRLVGDERVFFYMPLMHSETLADQERCLELFQAFHDQSSGALRERLAANVKYARAHRDIIERWQRFPHRNAILSRQSTPEEIEFLKTPGSSF